MKYLAMVLCCLAAMMSLPSTVKANGVTVQGYAYDDSNGGATWQGFAVQIIVHYHDANGVLHTATGECVTETGGDTPGAFHLTLQVPMIDWTKGATYYAFPVSGQGASFASGGFEALNPAQDFAIVSDLHVTTP